MGGGGGESEPHTFAFMGGDLSKSPRSTNGHSAIQAHWNVVRKIKKQNK